MEEALGALMSALEPNFGALRAADQVAGRGLLAPEGPQFALAQVRVEGEGHGLLGVFGAQEHPLLAAGLGLGLGLGLGVGDLGAGDLLEQLGLLEAAAGEVQLFGDRAEGLDRGLGDAFGDGLEGIGLVLAAEAGDGEDRDDGPELGEFQSGEHFIFPFVGGEKID